MARSTQRSTPSPRSPPPSSSGTRTRGSPPCSSTPSAGSSGSHCGPLRIARHPKSSANARLSRSGIRLRTLAGSSRRARPNREFGGGSGWAGLLAGGRSRGVASTADAPGAPGFGATGLGDVFGVTVIGYVLLAVRVQTIEHRFVPVSLGVGERKQLLPHLLGEVDQALGDVEILPGRLRTVKRAVDKVVRRQLFPGPRVDQGRNLELRADACDRLGPVLQEILELDEGP